MSGQPGFRVDLEVFSGPLDLLLDLAQRQKVDLTRISILRLAEQYLAYLEGVGGRELPIAAEYLVMAAWLAYLKSQLLLPVAERELPDPEEAAQGLAERLRQLDAIRRAAAVLLERPRLGEARLARGAPEAPPVTVEREAGLGGLLKAYAALTRRAVNVSMRVPPRELMAVEAALARLSRLLTGHDWRDLMAFLPPSLTPGLHRRSAVASNFVAGLELARAGRIELRQAAPFGPIMVRRC